MASIGIDLGTTHSACGVWDGDDVQLIPNRLGEVLTPSVVGVDDDGTVLVGRTAQQRLIVHSDRTVADFKRVMGTEQSLKLGQRFFTPVELSSLVLQSLKEDAEQYLGSSIDEAVISVPAYFNNNQRYATKVAAELVGLSVKRLVNEPTAAALAYGLSDRREGLFLILDFGGGTFDVSLLEYFDGVMEVHASAGDNFLGGNDFTQAMVDALLREQGIDGNKLASAKRQTLYTQMDGAKRELARDQSVTRQVDLGSGPFECTITGDWLERVCSSLLVRLRTPIERALRDAGQSVDGVDEVILLAARPGWMHFARW